MQSLGIKRHHLDVLTEILFLCRSPRIKTRVMQKANISYDMLQKCLNELEDLELIEFSEKVKTYKTTQKGKVFLQRWVQLQELLHSKDKLLIKKEKHNLSAREMSFRSVLMLNHLKVPSSATKPKARLLT